MSQSVPYHVRNASGRIVRAGYCQEDMLIAQAGLGEFAAPGYVNGLTTYHDGTQLAPRTPLPAWDPAPTLVADGVAVWSLDNLPAGTRVTIHGPGINRHDVVDDGSWSLSTTQPGDYRLTVDAAAHLVATCVLTASPP